MKKPSRELLAALPDEVPIPEPLQWLKGRNFAPSKGACCLRGWCWAVFTGSPYPPSYNAIPSRLDVLVEELASFVAGTSDPVRWNDDGRRSPETIARRWEEAMRELGYTEDR